MIGTPEARRRARALVPVLGLLGGLATMMACGDDTDVTAILPITPVVAVFKDSTFDFTTLATYAMPDTVAHLTPLTGTALPVTTQFDAEILSRVRLNLANRGYVQVANPTVQQPNFVVLVGTTATTNYNAFVGYSWFGAYGYSTAWGWFGPGFNNAWIINYPWYSFVGVTAYNQGSILVTIIPTSSINTANQTFKAAWAGVATSVLVNPALTSATIDGVIDQMFTLSPYLVAPTVIVTPH